MEQQDYANKIHLGRPWQSHWRQFDADMHQHGIEVQECAGPNGWGGPAVTVPSHLVEQVTNLTSVKLDSHAIVGANDGRGAVMLYPAPVAEV